MRVCYIIQTHKNPKQISRLVQTIKKSSPKSYILLVHDFTACSLNEVPIQELAEFEVLQLNGKGKRADFSMLQGYLDALDWIFNCRIDFDWLINLSGQDYPTQSLLEMEKFLDNTFYDGFLNYYQVISNRSPWGIREGRERYFYHYWHSSNSLSAWQRALLKPLRILINNTQPLIRFNCSYDNLMVGFKTQANPFSHDFLCYGGSYFHTLSKKCVQFIHNFSKQNTSFVDFYRRTSVPVESFIQTVLINSNLFNICNDNKRYINFSRSRHGHPKILTVEDYSILANKSGIYFARKFDAEKDEKILDLLDAIVIK